MEKQFVEIVTGIYAPANVIRGIQYVPEIDFGAAAKENFVSHTICIFFDNITDLSMGVIGALEDFPRSSPIFGEIHIDSMNNVVEVTGANAQFFCDRMGIELATPKTMFSHGLIDVDLLLDALQRIKKDEERRAEVEVWIREQEAKAQ